MLQEEEISKNSGTETDLREINQTEARCNGEKPQETPKKNFLQENQNCDEVTVEKKDKKSDHNTGGRAHSRGGALCNKPNFLTISKKIIKMCLFLWNTTTEIQAKMCFYQYAQSEV